MIKIRRPDGPAKKRYRLSGMQIASIALAALVLLCCAAFAAYLNFQSERLRRRLAEYPVAYTDLIARYAVEYDLDPYLVTSIMRCESSNDPNAVSHRGATGLMQVMPDTGEWIAHKLGMDDTYDASLLYDPETNIRFGCWYLGFLNGRFGRNVMQVVAAYNAGHGSVENWLSDERFSSDGELTAIPFEETARYYKKVMTAYENYLSLYPELFAKEAGDVAGAAAACYTKLSVEKGVSRCSKSY